MLEARKEKNTDERKTQEKNIIKERINGGTEKKDKTE